MTKSQTHLFAPRTDNAPLAERLRPKTLADLVGQPHVLGEGKILEKIWHADMLPSMILWGPPGSGKTTIARLFAEHSGYDYKTVSAVSSGTADLKKIFEEAREALQFGKRTILFVDEIHRFNRAQQDVLLQVVEDGTITLIGATTENPSFEVNSALLSRTHVIILERLDEEALEQIAKRAEKEIGKKLHLTKEAREKLIQMADGDGRALLNMCELLFTYAKETLNEEQLAELVQRRAPVYDKSQESHYNLISALHKSLRGSDVDAALYWLCRMLDGGEDPLYIVRRLVRFASEDIGMADPQALQKAVAARESYHFLGSPEGELAIAELVIYLATAPKSNAAYMAFKAAMRDAKEHGSLMPPKHILNAPTKAMKEWGYSKGYAYDHDEEYAFSGQNYFPETMERVQYYRPPERGFEREIHKRLEYWAKLRKEKQTS